MDVEVEAAILTVASDKDKDEGRELTEMDREDKKDDDEEEDEPDFECSRAYCTRLFCQMNIYWQTLILFAIVVLYLLFGGAIFLALEQPAEIRRNEELMTINATYYRALENVSVQLANLTNLTVSEAETFLRIIGEAAINVSSNLPTNNWDYGPAVFFATTVVTTIGYGSIAPQTAAGQGIFIPYALIGIPITLIFLGFLGQILGKALAKGTKRLGKRLKVLWVRTLIITIIALVALIFIPSIIFAVVDGWTYFQAVYFSFVSLTTVGFGDYVPTTPGHFAGLYRVCATCWLFIGLAFLALIITQTQERIENLRESVQKCTKCIQEKRKGAMAKLKDQKETKEKRKSNGSGGEGDSEKESSEI